MADIVSVEVIATKIYEARGRKVMLDRDLTKLYSVETKYLIRQVKRNIKRFPDDFMYQLNEREVVNLRCQNVTSSWGGRRYIPYVFTEQGVAMLLSVLNSNRAIRVNIQIMKAFVQLRKMLITNSDLRRKIEKMKRKYDKQFMIVFKAIKKLLEPPQQTNAIGFYI